MLGVVGLQRDHESKFLLIAGTQHFLLLWFFVTERKTVIGSHVF